VRRDAARPEHRMSSPTDVSTTDARRAALMAASQSGNQDAYRTLLRECIPFIRSVAARRVDAALVDDVVQETLVTVHRARHTYDARRSFNAWLRTLAMRRAIDIMRRAGRLRVREVHAPAVYHAYVDQGADPTRDIRNADLADEIGLAVAALPERQREAVEQLVMADMSLDQAAGMTGRGKGALKVNLHRAIRTLRAKLEREFR
jgi:RNA polymerase sigma-70 factor (ECF subfamily)